MNNTLVTASAIMYTGGIFTETDHQLIYWGMGVFLSIMTIIANIMFCKEKECWLI